MPGSAGRHPVHSPAQVELGVGLVLLPLLAVLVLEVLGAEVDGDESPVDVLPVSVEPEPDPEPPSLPAEDRESVL